MTSVKKKFGMLGHVWVFGFFGILAGMILGFVFGALIGYVSELFVVVDGPNMSIGVFFGMGVGSVIGGVFGGVVGYKK